MLRLQHPYAYPPGMQQPPTGYPLQPVSLPAPHYGQPPPVPPQVCMLYVYYTVVHALCSDYLGDCWWSKHESTHCAHAFIYS